MQDCLVAAGCYKGVKYSTGNALTSIDDFIKTHPGHWLFGHMGYGLKNEIAGTPVSVTDNIGFADLYFFIPEIVVRLGGQMLMIDSFENNHVAIFQEISSENPHFAINKKPVKLQPEISKEHYIKTVEKLKQHILRGDCYEINYCQAFTAAYAVIDPVTTFLQLTAVSPNPFSVFYRVNDSYLLCASPERFLMKRGQQLISQPIKGTAPRNPDNETLDEAQKTTLQQSRKERSENVMVVDLVRNDLSKVATEGSVQVNELFKIYSYPQVHQMVSTISGTITNDISFGNIIAATFPMGSMTGAPKKRVMELIDQYETSTRGIFSGAVGYISPNGDFDFNVVIRSILYNAGSASVSVLAGSAITFYCDAATEYEECLLKIAAMRKILEKEQV